MANRLADATSPYLLQHADNPVDWREWGPEAFEEARRRDVPVLLSVGYAACHWCHVMAHESFEDDEVARVVNDGLRRGQGGPRGAARHRRRLHGGDDRPDRAGRVADDLLPHPRRRPVLRRDLLPARPLPPAARGSDGRLDHPPVDGARQRRPHRLAAARAVSAAGPGQAVDEAALDVGRRDPAGPVRPRRSGIRRRAEVPPVDGARVPAAPPRADRLGRRARDGRADLRGDGPGRALRPARAAASPATPSTPAGSSPTSRRCSTTTPSCCASSPTCTAPPAATLARRVAEETADFLVRDLGTAEGGFASALDADADGVEGLTYAWSPAQLVEVLGPDDGARAAELLLVTAGGHLRARPLHAPAAGRPGRRRVVGRRPGAPPAGPGRATAARRATTRS